MCLCTFNFMVCKFVYKRNDDKEETIERNVYAKIFCSYK